MQSKPPSSNPRITPLESKPPALTKTGVTHLIHRRTGKIARLPREARELLNLMLRDGTPYALISKKMAETGHKISENNLSRWHTGGGYADWLREQSCLEEVRLRLDFANEIVHEKNVDLIDAASLPVAVTRLYTLLMTFDPSQLSSHIANQPLAYTRILNALCKLTEASIKCERHRSDKLHKAQASQAYSSFFGHVPESGPDLNHHPSEPIRSNLHQSAPNHASK